MRIISLEDGKQVAKETSDPAVKGQIKQDLGLDKVENKTDAERVQSGPIKQALDNKVSIGENGKAFSPIGTYNATTNTATKNDGSTSNLVATPDNTLPDGSTYRIITAGTLGFAGRNFASGQAVNVGDELTKFGTQWVVTLYQQIFSRILGKNKYNKLNNELGFIQDSTFDYISTGVQASNSLSCICKVLPNKDYCLSGIVLAIGTENIQFLDTYRTKIGGISLTSLTFKTPNDCYYIRLCIKFNGGTDYSNITQLEEGLVSTTFEAYQEVVNQINNSNIFAKAIISEDLTKQFSFKDIETFKTDINELKTDVSNSNTDINDIYYAITKINTYTLNELSTSTTTVNETGELFTPKRLFSGDVIVTNVLLKIIEFSTSIVNDFKIQLYASNPTTKQIVKIGQEYTVTKGPIGNYNIPVNFILQSGMYLTIAVQNGVKSGYNGTSSYGFSYKYGINPFGLNVGFNVEKQYFTTSCGVGFIAQQSSGDFYDFKTFLTSADLSAFATKDELNQKKNYLYGKK